MARITNTNYFSIDMNFINKQHLDELYNYVQNLLKMKDDKNFQKFIQDKCMKTLDMIMNDNLVGGTTNDDAIDLYMSSNHIEEFDEGFIMYNDAKIPANVNGVQNTVENYPDGQFSIALAFEYGVGIIGENTNNPNAWNYNLQGYYFGWYLPSNVTGKSKVETGGYQGFQIYTLTAQEIERQLPSWVNEYMAKEV